ncbi:MAG: hypothetical protein QXS41_02105 [Candidatus Woesearchaeota archaeon]
MVKKQIIVLLLIFLSIFVSCEQQQEQSSSSRPVDFFVSVSPQNVEKGETFSVYGYVKNNGDSDMSNLNLEIVGLDKNYFSGTTNRAVGKVSKNEKAGVISSDFNIDNLKYSSEIYSSNKFDFYLKASYDYSTSVKSLICVSLDNPSCKGNFKENLVSKGFIAVYPRTTVQETKDKYVLYITYDFSVDHGVKIEKVKIDDFKIDIGSITNKNFLVIGRTVEDLGKSGPSTNKEVILSNDKMVIQWVMEIPKNGLGFADFDIPIYINLSYNVIEYFPLSVVVNPSR